MDTLLEFYIFSVCMQAGLGLFVTFLAAMSLRAALDNRGYGDLATDYALNTWAPKSRGDVKFGLMMIATSPIAPAVWAFIIVMLVIEVGAGIREAFRG